MEPEDTLSFRIGANDSFDDVNSVEKALTRDVVCFRRDE